MRLWMMAGWILCWAFPSWAATTLDTIKPVKASALTSEMKVLVPTLEGLDADRETTPGKTRLTIRRLTGEFSPAEVLLLQQALTAHDASALSESEQELRKNPNALTETQRLKRLETILGVN